jgi:hypothetical protein
MKSSAKQQDFGQQYARAHARARGGVVIDGDFATKCAHAREGQADWYSPG